MLFGGINATQILNGHLHDFELVNNKWWALRFTEFRYNETVINQDPHKDQNDDSEVENNDIENKESDTVI